MSWWDEDRARLQEEVRVLREECAQAATENALRSSREGTSMEPRTASLQREKDQLVQRLRAAELVRGAAESRRSTAEAALRRASDELSSERLLVARGVEAARTAAMERLHLELSAAQSSKSATEKALTARQDKVATNEQEQEAVRIEHSSLSAANDTLRQEIAGLQQRLSAESNRLESMEAESEQEASKRRARDLHLTSEIETLRLQAQHLESEVARSAAERDAAEAASSEDRVETLEAQGALDALAATQQELQAQQRSNQEAQRRQLTEYRARAERFGEERALLVRRLAEIQASTERVHFEEQEQRLRHTSEVQSLARERSLAEETCLREMSEVRASQTKVESLLAQLEDERQQTQTLAREFSMARIAADEASGVPPWRSAQALDKGLVKSRSSEDRAVSLELQREMELLRHWKGDAVGALHRMQSDMVDVQRKYMEQLSRNQELQQRLEAMGSRARSAVDGASGGLGGSLGSWPGGGATAPSSGWPASLAAAPSEPLATSAPSGPATGAFTSPPSPFACGYASASASAPAHRPSAFSSSFSFGPSPAPASGPQAQAPVPTPPSQAHWASPSPASPGLGSGTGPGPDPGPSPISWPTPPTASIPWTAPGADQPRRFSGLWPMEPVAAGFPSGPDLPERPDLGASPLPGFASSPYSPPSVFDFGAQGDGDEPRRSRETLDLERPTKASEAVLRASRLASETGRREGPVRGPFYESFATRTSSNPQQVAANRLSTPTRASPFARSLSAPGSRPPARRRR